MSPDTVGIKLQLNTIINTTEQVVFGKSHDHNQPSPQHYKVQRTSEGPTKRACRLLYALVGSPGQQAIARVASTRPTVDYRVRRPGRHCYRRCGRCGVGPTRHLRPKMVLRLLDGRRPSTTPTRLLTVASMADSSRRRQSRLIQHNIHTIISNINNNDPMTEILLPS